MEIKIHRGLDQIGGCITEICTDSSRVFIDFGQNQPSNGKAATPEEDTLMVADIIRNNEKEHQAVFYTHAHEDHVGLFRYILLEQYIGEGSKELLLIKYRTLLERYEMAIDENHQLQEGSKENEELQEENYRTTKDLIDKLKAFKNLETYSSQRESQPYNDR